MTDRPSRIAFVPLSSIASADLVRMLTDADVRRHMPLAGDDWDEAKAVDWAPKRRAHVEPSADGGAITMDRFQVARSETATWVVGGSAIPVSRYAPFIRSTEPCVRIGPMVGASAAIRRCALRRA